ncbi:MAG: hypothetical protein A2758_01360 [Candidatus Zambryskibacteria bacterium RIFCSPHIGHO2_01_FULL_49_18]|uniref:Uncharacterized protein n=2 Tax=Candidatus Zambryskiibacteriota TaxID=1817925 RepID=A0A1G2T2J1_9BACT|nr:MAG: hypothetical protein A2758_01360 [Candidatus Zambryskibacteria bacterium RIFCSPHIGHO2_01_FULL_49_18]OHB05310.1 MAG: hypothetical protein A3A26_01835 [Candidatus Zambryskibacteria bacterium RIFCSPLOWO2_01_FULL_47_14]
MSKTEEVEAHRAHIRRLADERCKAKHREYYDSLICIGPNESGFGPPCDGCVAEEEKHWQNKRATVVGRKLSPEETRALKEKLGIED